MDDRNKDLPPTPDPLSQSDGFDTAFLAASHEVREVARSIRARYGDQLTRVDWVRVVRGFSAEVVPKRKPGRKPKAQVTAAVEDFKRGVRGIALYSKHIRDWHKMADWRRREQSRALMEAIRSRLRRDRKRVIQGDPLIPFNTRMSES